MLLVNVELTWCMKLDLRPSSRKRLDLWRFVCTVMAFVRDHYCSFDHIIFRYSQSLRVRRGRETKRTMRKGIRRSMRKEEMGGVWLRLSEMKR